MASNSKPSQLCNARSPWRVETGATLKKHLIDFYFSVSPYSPADKLTPTKYVKLMFPIMFPQDIQISTA